MKQKMIGLALMIYIALLACNRQGPMGPEGPQGPDGPPGTNGTGTGGSANNVVSFTVTSDKQWIGIDGGNSYTVWGSDFPKDYFTLPDSLDESIDSGLTLVYLRSVENDYYRLPAEIGRAGDEDHEIYDYFFTGNQLHVYAKTHDIPGSVRVPTYNLNTLKVIVGKATQTGVLKLTD